MATFITALVVLVLQTPQEPVVPAVPTDFRAGVERYVELRENAVRTLPPRQVTANAAELQRWERTLSAAVRAARARARQGEIFTPAAGAEISTIIAADRMRRSADDQSALMTDVPLAVPVVNQPYPPEAALATFPPLLLAALPPLPDELEYRYMGRYLIIRDAKTNLIVDYLLELTPARSER